MLKNINGNVGIPLKKKSGNFYRKGNVLFQLKGLPSQDIFDMHKFEGRGEHKRVTICHENLLVPFSLYEWIKICSTNFSNPDV